MSAVAQLAAAADPEDGALHREWLRCRPWIEDALKHEPGEFSIDDVEQEIAKFEAHFWPGKNCAAVTQFMQFPQAKVLNVWLCGGDGNELVEKMLPAVEAFAKAAGCARLTGRGRIGWERLLSDRGFDCNRIYRKEL